MSQTRHELAMLVNEYKVEINKDINGVDYIIESLGDKATEEIKDALYNATIISMCIKYEAFTSDAYGIVVDKDVSFNHPWDYTRKIAKRLSINISDEYEKAHYAWEYYNALKHSNKTTRIKLVKFWSENKFKNTGEVAHVVNKLLNDLLNKFR